MSLSPAWNLPDGKALAWNIAAFLGSVLGINGLIFGLGWADTSEKNPPRPLPAFAPPDWVIGAVWTTLFVCFAVARWEVSRVGQSGQTQTSVRVARHWITALVVSCLLYPLYALATGSTLAGFCGNIETIVLATLVVCRVWPVSHRAAFWVAPVIGWVAFATCLTALERGWM